MLPLLLDGIKAKPCAENISRHRPCGIAVSVVIDSGDHSGGEVALMTKRALKRNAKRFLRNPAFSQPVDIVEIIPAVFRKLNSQIHYACQCVDVLVSGE